MSRFEAEYPMPNVKMLHKDEKQQANKLLYELLRFIVMCGEDYSRCVVPANA